MSALQLCLHASLFHHAGAPATRSHILHAPDPCKPSEQTATAVPLPRPLPRLLKSKHRDRAAYLGGGGDPLQELVTDRLLDRLEDCKRKFPRVAVIGGAGGWCCSRGGGPGGMGTGLADRCRRVVAAGGKREMASLAACSMSLLVCSS